MDDALDVVMTADIFADVLLQHVIDPSRRTE